MITTILLIPISILIIAMRHPEPRRAAGPQRGRRGRHPGKREYEHINNDHNNDNGNNSNDSSSCSSSSTTTTTTTTTTTNDHNHNHNHHNNNNNGHNNGHNRASLIELFRLEQPYRRPHFTGTFANNRGVRFHRIRDFKQYFRCL